MWEYTVFKSPTPFLSMLPLPWRRRFGQRFSDRAQSKRRFVVNPLTGSARLETSRPIQAGGEIFVSYGPEYWRGAHSTSHITSLVPVWEWDCSDPFTQLSV